MNILTKAMILITAALSGVESLLRGSAVDDILPPCPDDSYRRQGLVPGIIAFIHPPKQFLNSTLIVKSMEAFATGSGIFRDVPSDCSGKGTSHVTCPGGYLLKDAFTRQSTDFPVWRYRMNDTATPRGQELFAFFNIHTSTSNSSEAGCCSPTAQITYVAS